MQVVYHTDTVASNINQNPAYNFLGVVILFLTMLSNQIYTNSRGQSVMSKVITVLTYNEHKYTR